MGPLPATPASLQLVCLGPPTARVDGHEAPPEVLWPKHLALLIYLALSAPTCSRSRDHLLGVFWPERPQVRARHALRAALSRLRCALGSGRLLATRTVVTLQQAGLEVDVARLTRWSPADPETAVALLTGDFLDGFHLDDAPEFDDWVMRERARCRALASSVLVAAGERRLAAAQFASAADAARRALALAPHAEPAIRLLLRASALGGDTTGALVAFGDFCTRLGQGRGERPGQMLTALADRLRRGSWRPASGSEAVVEPQLVGREWLHREALDAVARASTQGPVALAITGAPGMGRTRLLGECARRAAIDGAAVVLARPVESDQDAPWSALRLMLRAGLATAPGLTAARPEALAALAGLLPEMAERYPAREAKDVSDMSSALASVLGAAAEECPLALVLDDAQWADGPSLAALGAAVTTMQGVPLLLLVSVAASSSDVSRELLQLMNEIGRGVPGHTVRLQALRSADVAELVASLAPWCSSEGERERLTRRLVVEAGGNPLFTVTLLRALERGRAFRRDIAEWPPPGRTFDAPLPFSVPSIVRHAISLRVAELDADARLTLGAASVCGDALDLGLIAQVSGRSNGEVERAMPALERSQLVAFDGRRYTIAAPLVAAVVRMECLTRGERRRLEERAVDALRSWVDLGSRALLSELLARVAPDRAALECALGTARDALSAGATRTARRALNAAEQICADAQLDQAELDQLRARV